MKKILRIISINEYEIIGSYTDDKIKRTVVSDIDGVDTEDFDYNDKTTLDFILKHFQEVYKKFKNNKRIVITDFKCGVGNANVPYRWTYRDIMRGYLYHENKRVYFIDQLLKKSVIKIDVLAFTYKHFKEITMNYYFIFGRDSSFRKKDINEVKIDLKKDALQLRDEGNYYKALKRLHSYNRLIGKDDKDLISVINSNYGIKSRDKNKLTTLLYAMNNRSKFNREDIDTANKDKLTKKQIENKIKDLDLEINNEYLKNKLIKNILN